mgnify:CR=1 FL=1
MLFMALPNLICGFGLLPNWGGWVIVLAVILLAVIILFEIDIRIHGWQLRATGGAPGQPAASVWWSLLQFMKAIATVRSEAGDSGPGSGRPGAWSTASS